MPNQDCLSQREGENTMIQTKSGLGKPIRTLSSFCKATSGFTQLTNQLGVIVEKTTTA